MTALAWIPVGADAIAMWRPGSNPQIARRGDWRGLVWHEGDAMPCRSTVRQRSWTTRHVVAHRTEDAAKIAAESRMKVPL